MGRHEGNGQKLHARLLRRPTRFMIVAALASRHHIAPKVEASLTEGFDMITREVGVAELIAAVKAEMVVASEKGLITERRGVFGRGRGVFSMMMIRSDDRVDLDSTSLPGSGIHTTVERVEGGPAAIGHKAQVIELRCLLVAQPFQGHT